jgi:hypothetical protein
MTQNKNTEEHPKVFHVGDRVGVCRDAKASAHRTGTVERMNDEAFWVFWDQHPRGWNGKFFNPQPFTNFNGKNATLRKLDV